MGLICHSSALRNLVPAKASSPQGIAKAGVAPIRSDTSRGGQFAVSCPPMGGRRIPQCNFEANVTAGVRKKAEEPGRRSRTRANHFHTANPGLGSPYVGAWAAPIAPQYFRSSFREAISLFQMRTLAVVFSVQTRWLRNHKGGTLGLTAAQAVFVSETNPSKIVVLDYALVVGYPALRIVWMSRHGHKSELASDDCAMICPGDGFCCKEVQPGVLHCLDFDEESALPAEPSNGTKSYKQSREETKYAGPTA